MKINDVKKIAYDEDVIEVLIGIQLDAETTNRWELEDPNALVTYRPFDKLQVDNIDLVDGGIKVHGYEFNEKEEEEISNFIKENVLQ